jgi:hypothetical protein
LEQIAQNESPIQACPMIERKIFPKESGTAIADDKSTRAH